MPGAWRTRADGRDCTGNPRQLDEGADMAFVTRWPCRNASLASVSVNDRLRNTSKGPSPEASPEDRITDRNSYTAIHRGSA
jgi:hypothetical protein